VVGLVLEWFEFKHKWLSFPAYFLVINAASAVGVMKSLLGEKIDVWEPERQRRVRSGGTTTASRL
jgi:hypothetical protein